ncbi:TPA: ribonuclease P protein subunit, partial [Candidatus Bathyarchaeota archaeon]|nr:ribonuclease P protein subunit [Candidatus Bathyarchaeota archaeon]
MKITPRNLVNHELIGLKVKVKRCRNQQLVKFEGLVVDETRNML